MYVNIGVTLDVLQCLFQCHFESKDVAASLAAHIEDHYPTLPARKAQQLILIDDSLPMLLLQHRVL